MENNFLLTLCCSVVLLTNFLAACMVAVNAEAEPAGRLGSLLESVLGLVWDLLTIIPSLTTHFSFLIFVPLPNGCWHMVKKLYISGVGKPSKPLNPYPTINV